MTQPPKKTTTNQNRRPILGQVDEGREEGQRGREPTEQDPQEGQTRPEGWTGGKGQAREGDEEGRGEGTETGGEARGGETQEGGRSKVMVMIVMWGWWWL